MKKRLISILSVLLMMISIISLVSCGLTETGTNNQTPTVEENGSSTTGTTDSGNTNTTTKYTVKFNVDGGSSISSQKVESGKTATKPNDPTKKGYSFGGWYNDSSLTTEFDFTSIISGNVTIYAKWNINSYSVTFDSKGGTEIDSQTINYNEKITKPTDPEKDGYTFGGWYTSSYYLTAYDFSKGVTGDLKLYAKWNEIPKTVKYEVGTPTIGLWTDSIGSNWMKIAIPITNTGTADLYLNDCSVDIESASGQLLQTKSYINGYPEYIKPGETGYYYEETTRSFTETDVKVVPHVEIEKATNDVIRYDVSDITIQENTLYGAKLGVKIMGRVENKTSKKGTLVKVAANLFDANGNLLCTCFTYLENDLAAGSKVGFTMSTYSFRDFAPEDVASYEVYAYPTQYNW